MAGGAYTEASPTASPIGIYAWEPGRWGGKLSIPFEMESSEGAATARDSECSGRGDGGEAEQGGALEQGWAPTPVATWEDEADTSEPEENKPKSTTTFNMTLGER